MDSRGLVACRVAPSGPGRQEGSRHRAKDAWEWAGNAELARESAVFRSVSFSDVHFLRTHP
jgi:hypothetical protein